MVIISGGCSCGAVRYEADRRLSNRCFCHCKSCRRASGAPFVAWATVATDRFKVTGNMNYFASSPQVRRGFCGTCGTCLTYEHQDRENELDITLASLDEPNDQLPEYHIWVSNKLESIVIGDDLPQYQGWKPAG